ncbi:putative bifunctional diguanylate cyclase/phosphodiesterase [Tepidimonas charontis]|uniref:Putative signaling protein n=1 Tax=Tepidimonas charontis TaxID=2267262 RepID=A0A554XDI7_9BURK|nr:EAL domain-containing protein [Tepidimonas charontis]TSE33897.1 putative signaling protein [Tepidimonas charontis]
MTTPFFASTLPGSSAASEAVDGAARSGRLSVAELFDHLRHALVVLDAQARVVGYNHTALQLLELPEDLMVTQPAIDEVVRWQHARGDLRGDLDHLLRRVWYHLEQVQATGEPHVYTYTTASGRTLQGATMALPGGGWVRTYTDISKHAQTLAALRDSEARFRSLTALSADWYWEADAEFRYTRIEGRSIDHDDMTRELAQRFLGRRPWDVPALNLPRPEDWAPLQQAVARGEVFRRWEVQRKLADGRTAWFALSGMPMHDAEGRLVGYRGVGRDITPRKEAEAAVHRLAFYDSLTGLYNRRAFHDRVQQAQAAAARSGAWAALCFIDLDNFKDINDAYGHATGDEVLRETARRLQATVRAEDTIGRLGGDEFIVLLEDLSADREQAAWRAQHVGEKIRAALEQPLTIGDLEVVATPSIGIALFAGEGESVEDILQRADMAMYESKAAGRNAVRFFDPALQERALLRVALQREMRHGLRAGEFVLHGQPIVDEHGRVRGQEALLRWLHPVRGLVSPMQFIPLAEESGFILPLGQWVLQRACELLAAWANDPHRCSWTLAVNLSARQLRQADLVQTVRTALKASGADPRRLKLELTESQLLHDVEDTISKMEALAEMGVQFALDDFGTGYSSLAYLKRLPLAQLKIDRTFVRDVLDDPNDAAIARTILQLAASLDLSVVAEGVETAAQFDTLRAMGCRLFQGYHFGRPAPL